MLCRLGFANSHAVGKNSLVNAKCDQIDFAHVFCVGRDGCHIALLQSKMPVHFVNAHATPGDNAKAC